MKVLIKFFLLASFLSITSYATTKEVVVLVPGFFSHVTPEYFSKTIINSFTSKGMKVFIANNLNPVGGIAENGARLQNLLEKIETAESHPVSFNIVAHSAGGLYSLWVSSQAKVKINKLITISTPFRGVEFVQSWIEKSFLFSTLADLAYLQGLQELTSVGVEQFLKTAKPAKTLQIFSFAGYQPQSLDVTDARCISAPLLVTSHYITGKSDGIVALTSALGYQNSQKSNDYIRLDHWEQIHDHRAFILLGTRNTQFIQQEQARFYAKLADLILQK